MRNSILSILAVAVLLHSAVGMTASFTGTPSGLLLPGGNPSDKSVPSEGYWDEISDGLKVRPQYQSAKRVFDGISEQRKHEFRRHSLLDLDNEYSLEPMPLILTEEEHKILTSGIEQRVRALHLFLQDHYSGKRSYRDAVIPGRVMDTILQRTGEYVWDGYIDPKKIVFKYGADIVRGPDGKFRIVEDNLGNVGGWGDFPTVRNSFLNHFPEFKAALPIQHDPEAFLNDLLLEYRKRANPPNGRIILIGDPDESSHPESRRVQEFYRNRGIDWYSIHDPRLIADDSGVYLNPLGSKTGTREPVGFVIVEGSIEGIDPAHPATFKKAMLEAMLEEHPEQERELLAQSASLGGKFGSERSMLAAKRKVRRKAKKKAKLARNQYENNFFLKNRGAVLPSEAQNFRQPLLKSILKGRVGSNQMPGTEIIDDKRFYIYVEKLIEFYLGEKPILENIPTKSFADSHSLIEGELDKQVFQETFQTFPVSRVVKEVDGLGGKEVWVGPMIPRHEFEEPIGSIRATPEQFISQQFIPLSRHNGRIIDRRVVAWVTASGSAISNTIMARSTPVGANGKVNLSGSGTGLVPLVASAHCKPALQLIGFGEGVSAVPAVTPLRKLIVPANYVPVVPPPQPVAHPAPPVLPQKPTVSKVKDKK